MKQISNVVGRIVNPIKTYRKHFAEKITIDQKEALKLSEYVFNGIRLILVDRITEVAYSGYRYKSRR